MNKFYVKAIGWSMEATGQILTKAEMAYLTKWCKDNDFEFDNIPGQLEDVLGGYNCYHTNGWQTGCVPLLELNRFFVFDELGKSSLAITSPLINNSKTNFYHNKDLDMIYTLKPRYNRLLAYFEEYKGVSAVWELTCEQFPKAEDFTISYAKFDLAKESFTFVTNLEFRGKVLERDFDAEVSVGKASYSKIY